ncbi:hypothetical protein L6164_012655 [Bauhinia variegata]|uniref:Uncharacterized protein n=1 Tax=Bauhinia variegata TaxID=167791 RepID=A0ACB9PBY1_BAUVA|nr:hypothetical protein L6164_012655 [Bauhinia variegata]
MGFSLPQEIIDCILSKLPAKSLARFCCVAKPWRDFIQRPRPNKVVVLLNRTPPKSLALFTLQGENLVPELIELENDFVYSYDANIIGVCNGLILIGISPKTYILWNPFIQKYRQIHCPDWNYLYCLCGFVYDPAAHEHKIVHVCYHENGVRTTGVLRLERTGTTWKEIKTSFPYGFPSSSSGVVINGAPHWVVGNHLSRERSKKIIWFDVAEEKFKEVPKPELECCYCDFDVAALNGSLCITAYRRDQEKKVELWVMKDCGVEESWTKLAVIPIKCKYFLPLSMVKDGDLLAEIDKSEVVVYDLKKETFKHITFSGPMGKIRNRPSFLPISSSRVPQECKVATFVESLVNPAIIGN